MREITIPCEVDFMAVASYGSATDSSGVVRILKDLDAPIEGRHVLIVEDIVDCGLTLQYLLRNLARRGPASLEVCALLTKPERRKVELQPRYVGFEIPNRFVDRLRPRPRRALPQPALRRRAGRRRRARVIGGGPRRVSERRGASVPGRNGKAGPMIDAGGDPERRNYTGTVDRPPTGVDGLLP